MVVPGRRERDVDESRGGMKSPERPVAALGVRVGSTIARDHRQVAVLGIGLDPGLAGNARET